MHFAVEHAKKRYFVEFSDSNAKDIYNCRRNCFGLLGLISTVLSCICIYTFNTRSVDMGLSFGGDDFGAAI